MTEPPDVVSEFVRLTLAGVRFEDEQLEFLRRNMSAAEAERIIRRLAAEYLRTLPMPSTDSAAPLPSNVTELDFLGLYFELVRRGARPDDPRLAAMVSVMSDDQLERGKRLIGELWLEATVPELPN